MGLNRGYMHVEMKLVSVCFALVNMAGNREICPFLLGIPKLIYMPPKSEIFSVPL